MDDIKKILEGNDISNIITSLKNSSYVVPDWSEKSKEYEPKLHEIVNDKKGRKDKVHADGSVDRAARIPIGLEKLLVKRMTEFTFAIPVKREYSNTESETAKAIAKAIESIYKYAHINTENIKRGKSYYASCEILTIWYTVEKPNTLYGFNSKYKLKCRTFSPMDGCHIYPLFDDTDDMQAISIEYKRRLSKDLEITYFETYTEDKHYKWKLEGGNGAWEKVLEEPIEILKIPGSFLWRKAPVFDELKPLREDLEYTISRNSDILSYNSSPVLKVSGQIIGDEKKGETRRIYRVEQGGDVSYVSWNQSIEALDFHIKNLLKFYWMQAQMPDISFDNMKSLGNIGYDSRRTLLTDAHLKIGEESGPWQEFLNRECNVIKAFLKKMNTSWANEVDNVEVEHIITPFIIEDEQAQIDMHMKANGGKPVESQRESIQRIGKSQDVDETIRQINEEAVRETAMKGTSLTDIFSAE